MWLVILSSNIPPRVHEDFLALQRQKNHHSSTVFFLTSSFFLLRQQPRGLVDITVSGFFLGGAKFLSDAHQTITSGSCEDLEHLLWSSDIETTKIQISHDLSLVFWDISSFSRGIDNLDPSNKMWASCTPDWPKLDPPRPLVPVVNLSQNPKVSNVGHLPLMDPSTKPGCPGWKREISWEFLEKKWLNK